MLLKHHKVKIAFKIIIIFSIIIFIFSLSASIYNGVSLTNLRNTETEKYATTIHLTLHPEPGINTVGIIYIPKDIQKNQSYPAVFIQHGMGGRKENMLSMALNFVKMGFVVATFDLRAHGQSNGYSTLGNKESDDMVYQINYLRNHINGTYVNISSIGLVGHSLGAETVILASYKSGLNSCVAIAPPSMITDIISMISGGNISRMTNYLNFYNPISNPAYLYNISLVNFVDNRTAAHPNPKNLLLITSTGDKTVPQSDVYNLFKNATGLSEPKNFTLYGSFKTGTATQMDVFPNFSHGNEQYTYISPDITKAAILWTARALLGDNATQLKDSSNMEQQFIMINFNSGWNVVESWFLINFLSLISIVMFSILLKFYGKEKKGYDRLPNSFNQSIFLPLKSSQVSQGSENSQISLNSQRNRTVKNGFLNIIFVLFIGGVILLLERFIYVHGLSKYFLVEMVSQLLFLVGIPFAIFLCVFYYLGLRIEHKMHKTNSNGKNITNQTGSKVSTHNSDEKIPILRKLGIANTPSSLIIGIIAGVILGLYYPLGLAIFTNWLKTESLFHPVEFIGQYFLGIIAIGVPIFIIELFFRGYISRLFSNKDIKRKVIRVAFGVILQAVIVFLIVIIVISGDTLFTGVFSYYGISFPMKIGFALIITAIITLIGISGIISTEISKSMMIQVMFCATFVPWLLMSMIPAI